MPKPIDFKAPLIGIFIISFCFLSFFLGPTFLERKHFSFIASSESQKSSVPESVLNMRLKVIQGNPALISLGITEKQISLYSIMNVVQRPLLINFWATWCPPCIEEFPSIEYLNRQLSLKNKNIPFLVTVSVDETEKDISKFYETLDYNPSLIVLHDIDGEVARTFGTSKFPETYLINSNARILNKWTGPQNWLSHEVMRGLIIDPPINN